MRAPGSRLASTGRAGLVPNPRPVACDPGILVRRMTSRASCSDVVGLDSRHVARRVGLPVELLLGLILVLARIVVGSLGLGIVCASSSQPLEHYGSNPPSIQSRKRWMFSAGHAPQQGILPAARRG